MFNENDLKNMVRNVSNSKDGLDFIYYLLDCFGTFSSKINLSNSELQNIASAIKKEQGEFILDLLRKYNFEKFIEIQRERNKEKCQKILS